MSSLPLKRSAVKKTWAMKENPGWLGYIGDEILPSYIGIIISHEIRIPINQPGFQWKEVKGFFRGSPEPQVLYFWKPSSPGRWVSTTFVFFMLLVTQPPPLWPPPQQMMTSLGLGEIKTELPFNWVSEWWNMLLVCTKSSNWLTFLSIQYLTLNDTGIHFWYYSMIYDLLHLSTHDLMLINFQHMESTTVHVLNCRLFNNQPFFFIRPNSAALRSLSVHPMLAIHHHVPSCCTNHRAERTRTLDRKLGELASFRERKRRC